MKSNQETLRDTTWRQIFRNFSNHNGILVIGADLAVGEIDGELIPLSKIFANKLVKDLDAEGVSYGEKNKDDLSYISLRWLKNIKNVNANDLQMEIQDGYEDYMDDVPSIYDALAALPFFLVINTGMDDYMHQAFQKAGKKSELLHFNYQRNQSSLIPEMTIETPVVYNLFGSFDKPESMIITKENQVDFVNGILKNVSTLPKKILQHFDEQKTYLFLGFDLNSWHLPLLFQNLNFQKKTSTFYINEQTAVTALKDFYEDSFHFRFINNDITSFVTNLKEGYTEWEAENKTDNYLEKSNTSYISSPQAGVNDKIKVLIMTAAPKNTMSLELEEEINIIDECLENSISESFNIKAILNVKKRKLLRILLRQQPQIIHFSGHGSGAGGLMFYGESGYADLVKGSELANLFRQFNDMISCVVLNACYTKEQAKTIAQYIPNVVGTNNAIGDNVARAFSEGFYTALFANETYERAFSMAMAHVGMHNFQKGGLPIFFKNGVLIELNQ